MPTLNLASQEYVDEHANDTSNPHNVTAEQIGAVTKSYVDNALANVKIPMTVSQTDITAGTTELADGALYLVYE